MTRTVGVVDYGAGNMFSIVHALRSVGAEPTVICSGEEWASFQPASVVLPGVGAYGEGMSALRCRGILEPLVAHSIAGRPLLGICLGAQLLLDSSAEFGVQTGLGLIPGSVVPFDRTIVRVPHIGWAPISIGSTGSPLFDGLGDAAWMYFVHSFHFVPSDASDVLSTSVLGPVEFASALARGSTFGVQFHPEKSGAIGLRLLENFIRIGDSDD